MEVIGIKDVNFKAKDGKVIQGVKLFVTDDSIKVNIGVGCDSIFFSDSFLEDNGLRLDDIQLGSRLHISYNKYGKIQSVSAQ